MLRLKFRFGLNLEKKTIDNGAILFKGVVLTARVTRCVREKSDPKGGPKWDPKFGPKSGPKNGPKSGQKVAQKVTQKVAQKVAQNVAQSIFVKIKSIQIICATYVCIFHKNYPK
jgi:hypothetical protein